MDEKILTKPLKSKDFSRWRAYARHVRTVHLSCSNTPNTDVFAPFQAMMVLALWQASTGEVLLPALRCVKHSEGLNESVLVLWHILKASLPENIAYEDIQNRKDRKYLKTALHYLVHTTPTVSRLYISLDKWPRYLWPSLLQFKTLRSLEIQSHEIIPEPETFFRVPGLEAGQLVWEGRDSQDERSFVFTMEMGVAGGKKAYLARYFCDIISLLPIAARYHQFEDLTIDCQAKESNKSPQDLLTLALASCPSVSTLNLGVVDTLDLDALSQTMTSLPMLKSLGIAAKWDVGQEDVDLAFGRVCRSAKDRGTPLLRLDIICPRMGFIEESDDFLGLSAASLQHVHDSLPQLEELVISLDSLLPFEETGPVLKTNTPSAMHPLRELHVYEVRKEAFRLSEPRQILVARFINYLFPCLEVFRLSPSLPYCCYTRPDIEEGWGVIEQLRKDFQGTGICLDCANT